MQAMMGAGKEFCVLIFVGADSSNYIEPSAKSQSSTRSMSMADGDPHPLNEFQVRQLFQEPWSARHELEFMPTGEERDGAQDGARAGDIPQSPAELGELTSSSYDLSVTRAGELNIPVVGSVGGGTSRRVVVLEWTRFKRLTEADGTELRYGFAIRFCLTVNKWSADLKLSLPFLSAQAELGNIQAAWTMEVRGLTGTKVNAAVLPPQPLSVETFVTARQSLEGIVAAINDPSTTFVPGILLSKTNPLGRDSRLRKSAIEAYALYSVFKGRNADRAVSGLTLKAPEEADSIRAVYESLDAPAGAEVPPESSRATARLILNGIKADT